MTHRLFRSIGIAMLVSLASTFSFAQSLNESLTQLSEAAAVQFIQPAFHPFGVSMNGGWLGRAPKAEKLSFDLEFGAVAMGTFMQENVTSFEMSKTYRLSEEQATKIVDDKGIADVTLRNLVIDALKAKDLPVTLYGPTIAGSSDRNVRIVVCPNGAENLQINDPRYPFPVNVPIESETVELKDATGILNGFPILPSGAPQLKLGTLYGTQAIVRFVPSINIDKDLGDFSYYGFGLQHNPNVWFNYDMPVDVSFGFLIQNAKVGDVVHVKGTSYGINISKTWGTGAFRLTPYAGALLEKSSIDVNYKQSIELETGKEDVAINFSLAGINKSRFTAGALFHLAVIDLAVDYNFGKMNSVTSGFFFSF